MQDNEVVISSCSVYLLMQCNAMQNYIEGQFDTQVYMLTLAEQLAEEMT